MLQIKHLLCTFSLNKNNTKSERCLVPMILTFINCMGSLSLCIPPLQTLKSITHFLVSFSRPRGATFLAGMLIHPVPSPTATPTPTLAQFAVPLSLPVLSATASCHLPNLPCATYETCPWHRLVTCVEDQGRNKQHGNR